MGMSASQGRLLSITSRLSDLEFQAQQTCNAKIRLSQSSQQITTKYTDAMDQKKLIFQTGINNGTPVYTDLTAKLLMSYNAMNSVDTQRLLKNKAGNVLVSKSDNKNINGAEDLSSFLALSGVEQTEGNEGYDKAKVLYYTRLYNEAKECGTVTASDDDLNNMDWLYDQLLSGELYLNRYNSTSNDGKGGFDSTSWQSGDLSIQEVDDESEIDKIKVEYEAEMATVQMQDKSLELDLKELETAHSALQTEYESVKKVVDKNIEGSFKSFG